MCYDMCIAFSTLANHNCLSLPSGYTKNTKKIHQVKVRGNMLITQLIWRAHVLVQTADPLSCGDYFPDSI